MEYRKLGSTGLKVSEICLGSMQFGWTADEALSFEILDTAWQAGVNFIDTANVYSRWVEGNPGGVAETIIGRWLKRSSIPRDQVVIATKVRGVVGSGPNDQGLSRAHIFNAVEASLKRLQVEYVDLYQAHWFDENTPIEETLRALDDLVHQGKVRYLGCSNFPAWRLAEALWTSLHFHLSRFDSLQPHYNLVHRAEFERELAGVCRAYSIGVIPYSPLAAGFLSSKYQPDSTPESVRIGRVRRYFTPQNWELLELMDAIGKEKRNAYGEPASVSQIALAWLLSNPIITSPIIGPRDLDQLHDNLGCSGLRLTEEEEQKLAAKSEWNS